MFYQKTVVLRMEQLTNVFATSLEKEKSLYVKPLRMHYKQNDEEKSWDMVESHDSVAIIIFNITRHVFVFVTQFRPAVYFGNIPEDGSKGKIDLNKYPSSLGFTLELCGKIILKNLPLNEMAAQAVLKECGYKVSSKNLEKIISYHTDVGVLGTKQTLYYCRVTDNMKVSPRGGVDDESICVIEMTIPEVHEYINRSDFLCPPSFLYAVHWFFNTKCKL